MPLQTHKSARKNADPRRLARWPRTLSNSHALKESGTPPDDNVAKLLPTMTLRKKNPVLVQIFSHTKQWAVRSTPGGSRQKNQTKHETLAAEADYRYTETNKHTARDHS